MSGSNPFRRSKILAAGESIPSVPDRNNNDAPGITASSVWREEVFDTDAHPPNKSVRIATPPIPSPAAPAEPSRSPSYFPAVPTTTTTTTSTKPTTTSLPSTTRTLYSSPPPRIEDSDDSSDRSSSDPFNPHASVVDYNDAQGDCTEPEQHDDQQATMLQHFQESANTTPASRSSVGHTEPLPGRGSGAAGRKLNATALDVDAFTRLLLTGNADGPAHSKKANVMRVEPTVSDLSTPSQVDKSENPEVESLTRPQQGAYSDSPPAAATLRAEPVDIQRSSSLKRPKPPPPKTRHGRPIKPEDSLQSSRKSSVEFDPSVGEYGPQPISAKPSISPLSADYREQMAAAVEAAPSSNSSDSGINSDASSLYRVSSQSRRPPTPPLARRHSQIHPNRTPQQRSRENPHRISMPPRGLGLQFPGPPSPGFRTPPPKPPSRRHGEPLGGPPTEPSSQSKSSVPQDQPAPSTTSAVEEAVITDSSSPPSRQPSIKRAPSGSAASMPPPPPPPRRARASSKGSSNNPPRPSQQLKPVEDAGDTEPPPSSHANDILADLSRLQQEVDSLRGQYENRQVSQ